MSSASSSPCKILLTESIHTLAVECFERHGFEVERLTGALKEDELVERIADVHVIGVRSKTQITPRALEAANKLMAIGCFCIGTNQVDLGVANRRGVPVFNAPFSNTRSVAELMIAEIVMLSRRLGDRLQELHRGDWQKTSTGSHEVRGKTLGIIGYGHIGSQVGVLAEAFGMHVIYHDVVSKLPMGNNRAVSSLDELLAASDFVTLHVPATPHTKMMMGPEQLAKMKPGAALLNASRGSVVNIEALADSLKSGHLMGAAIDVYPLEPRMNGEEFKSALVGVPNVVLTPHIGGSTQEAQVSIGTEVSAVLSKYLTTGATVGAVNFPQVELPPHREAHRILNVHKNVPGVMGEINSILSDHNANIHAQFLATDDNIGYMITDLDRNVSRDVLAAIRQLPTSIKTRILS